MSQVTFTFSDPEETLDIDLVVKRHDMAMALWRMTLLRNALRKNEAINTADDLLDEIDEIIGDLKPFIENMP